ncbi:MAG: VCBS repeat-containing protein, partial [Candidatus Delongbacteria bacterium]|nr:VCBS repeat-containing protein [Candidatus Delongbacteria bacterium]
MRKVFFILIVFVLNYLFAQNFTEIDSGLPGVWGSSTDWGDYDNDGDLDIVITGETAGYPDYAPITKIFRNNSGIFSDINAGLPGLGSSSVKWGDYDNDGDLDILLAGDLEFHDYFTAIYRNDNGTFNNINAGIINIGAGDISWIDFDVDGDLDVLVCGHTSDSEVTKLYRNDLGVFNDIKADLHPSASGSASWADYDNDGDPDLLLTGQYYPYYYECNIAIIYRNDSGVFKDIQANLPGVVAGIGKWGDYDNDGDPDIILTGTGAINNYTKTSITKIYRNDLGIFTDINAGLDEVTNSHTSWGDYDNDGDLDILVNGTSEETSNLSTYLYSNDNGIFNIVNEFTGIKYGSTAWGDYDNDGDLDILLSGATGSYSNYNPVSKIFRNDSTAASNTPPTIPDGLTAVVNGFDVTLSWNRASDNETLQNGLTYNLFIGTVSQTDNVMGSMSDLQNGFRKVINQGNAYQNTSITITGIGQGTYYWGVQSIDNNFCGSDFSGISTFTSTPVLNPPVALPASDITGNAFTANLERVLGAKKYFIKVATDSLFQNYVPGYYNTDISNVEAYRVTGLEPNTDYYYKFCAYNNVLYGYSNIIHTKTSQFLDIDCGITGNEGSSIDWGDYDNDGDLDILICGKDFATVYRNDSGVFTDINAGIKILDYNSSSWGDYDNDGDLDILTTGSNYSLIYRNDSGMFTDIEAGLRGVYEGSACWGDYDYDGDLDILLTGGSTLVYRNDAGSFTDIEAGLEPVGYSSADWGDYDNDGDLDIVLSGEGHSIIYRNDNGNFIDISAGLEGTSQSSVCWGDYDCDGDLDILLCGDASNVEITKIYRNDAGSFTDINAGLYGLRLGDASWADYDNDGDLDVLISGWDGSTVHTFLYSNNLGDFTPVDTGIDKLYYTSIAWGDYDNDGDLDLVISGDERFNEVTKIYNNTADIQNTAPSAPMNPSAVVNGFDVELSWEESTDPQTPAEGLTYNIYIGTTPGTGNILNCMSDATNGQRKIAKPGNTGSLNNIVIRNISSGTYYWGVQAVDDSYMGSGFSAETSFVSNAEIIPPTALSASHIFGKSFYANWEHTTGARGYILDAAADSLFNEFVPGYEGRNVYNVSKYQVSGLEPGTEYFYRVKAYNTTPTENSNVILLKTEKLDFIDTGNILTGLRYSSADWGDYDNDGDLDIVVTGVYTTTNYFRVSEIYRNDEGVFTKIDASLPSTRSGSVKWGDYDNDG